MVEQNGIIRSTFLGSEDHGIPTAWLHLDFAGSGQGFGGYTLTGAAAAFWIKRVLETVGAESWEKLPGKHVRVRREKSYDAILAIGHIIEDKWFYPRDEFRKEFPHD